MDNDDIAIVGAGCRFPGADDLSEFWRVLVNGENHVTEIPESRWKNDSFYNADPSEPGKSYVRKAGLLKQHDKWDNRLFGISDSEATRIDPQQRYVLECVHMALEDGGITRKQIYGSNTGVIIGCMNNDYKSICNSALKEVNVSNATGTSASILSARVSYVYNLHGTCFTLDTACSSALIAIHLAIQAIKTGDCDMVICGGVSSILSPDTFVTLCKARMLSSTGQCQSFCETADGYARGEGCGVVILKKLKAAFEDGNKVWATIKTGSNQDGSTETPMTAPSLQQQLELLKEVYETHGFNPEKIQYIEAHGTGTARGDPTELNALGKFFSTSKGRKAVTGFIPVGSVKTNIGHTESAAGIAGLLKVLLMMEYGKYVPSLHVESDLSNVNKAVDLNDYGITIITEAVDWPSQPDGYRFACLNSFGFGGSNVHAIIKQPKNTIKTERSRILHEPVPLCISGMSRESLHNNLAHLQRELGESTDSLYDIATRSFYYLDIYPYRTLIIGGNIEELRADCERKIISASNILPKNDVNTVFVYCGVGTTWPGMGQELMKENETFRLKILQIDVYLYPLTGWRISEKLMEKIDYNDPLLNHIAIFCVQVGLTEIWKSFGVVADKIIGQSVGEVAAAYSARYLSLEEAVKLIYHRSLILSMQKEGAMAVIGNLDVDIVENIIKCNDINDNMNVAVYSSPVSCTVSGEIEAIRKFKCYLNQRQDNSIFFKELSVKCAYHSHVINCCTDEIMERIDHIFREKGSTTNTELSNEKNMVSTVSGRFVSPSEIRNGLYWAKNIRQSVLFMEAVNIAYEESKNNIYLEIGPRPVLKAHLSNIFKDSPNVRAIPSMLSENEIPCLHRTLTELFELGKDICDIRLNKSFVSKIAFSPRHHFHRTSQIFIPKITQEYLAGYTVSDNRSHMFTQKQTDKEFNLSIDTVSTPFVFDHILSNKIIVPGATYIEAAFHAGSVVLKLPVSQLSISIKFVKTFSPKSDRQNVINLHVDSGECKELRFTITQAGQSLANGTVRQRPTSVNTVIDIERLKILCCYHKSRSEFYKSLKKLDFEYGDSLSFVQDAWLSETGIECLTKIAIPEKCVEEIARTHFHPAVLDSIFQIFGIFQGREIPMSNDSFVVPEGVDAVNLDRPVNQNMFCFAEQVKVTEKSVFYDAILMSKNGEIIGRIQNFKIRILQGDHKEQGDVIQAIKINWLETSTFIAKTMYGENRIVLLSDGQESKLDNAFRKYIDVLSIDIRDLESLQTNYVDNHTAIVYHATDNVEELDFCEENMFTNAIKRFSGLKTILYMLSELEVNVELTVLTENTQMCPGRRFICCNGSELWGMFRSAIHEGIYRNMKIVDIDRENLSTIDLISLIFSPSRSQVELAMSGSRIFQSKFKPFQTTGFLRRRVNTDKSQCLALYSRQLTYVDDPVLVLKKEEECRSESIRIVVESFTIHEKNIYPTLIDEENHCKSSDKGQGRILAIEGVGKVHDTKKEVIFLYPIFAGNIINVPKQHVVSKAEFPLYTSGTLLIANSIIQLTAAVKDGSKVLRIGEPSEIRDFGLKMFDILMESKNCTVEHLMTNAAQNLNHADTLVLTKRTTFSHVQMVMHRLPNVKKFISLSFLVQKDFSFLMQCYFPNIEVKILSSMEIFDTERIRITMPIIKNYMSDYCKNTINITNNFLHKLPMRNIYIDEILLKESNKCFSYKMSLFRSSASYIIVGGLTGLGWEILCLMAEMGAGVLVTLSRSKPSLDIKEEINQLETKYSCKIMCLQADVTNSYSLEAAFRSMQNIFPNHPIKGLFHGAGVLNDSMLLKLTDESVSSVMRPKILGALNLHKLSLNLSLDYFVVHSSIASMFGNPGQCNYAAGNSFLDSFVQYRRIQGLPAQSINWGPLTIGMAAKTDKSKSLLEKKGFKSMNRENIRKVFMEAIQSDSSNVVYADIVWETLLSLPTFANQSSKYSEFNKFVFSRHEKFRHIDPEEILKLDAEKRMKLVKETLREIIQDVFVTGSEALKDDLPIIALGIDSMAVMSLSSVIEEVFGCRISFMVLNSDETTLTVIAEYIIKDFETGQNSGELKTEQPVNVNYEYLFESRDITFMQRDLLEDCFVNKSDPYYLRVLDIQMSGIKINMNEWVKIIRRVLKMHPELRKRFYFSENGDITVEEVSEYHSSIKIKQITKKEFETQHREDIRLSMSDEISNILPVSFRVALSGNKTYLRIIHHAVVVDLKGLSLLCKAIAVTVPEVLLENEEVENKKGIDITEHIKKAVLPKIVDLNSFWDAYLNLDIRPISLGQDLRDVNEQFCCYENIDVPKIQFQAIRNYIAKMKITMYEFVMSLYHIFLYIGSHSTVVTIGSAADLRYHVPELRHVITRCTNYIPVIANINEESSISEFIQTNSAMISTTTQHGAFPSSLILRKLPNDKVRRNVFRHFLAMNDLTGVNTLLNKNDYIKTKFRKMLLARPTRETFIYVRYDLQELWMKFELGYNSEICGKFGTLFPELILMLADEAVANGDQTVATIRDKMLANIFKKPIPYSEIPFDGSGVKMGSSNMSEVRMHDSSKSAVHMKENAVRDKQLMKNHTVSDTKIACGKDTPTFEVPKKEITILAGDFQKQTKHGWDHTVQATLGLRGHGAIISWGKKRLIRKQYSKSVNISEMICVTTRKINGMPSLIIETNKKQLVFKSSKGGQVQRWMEAIEEALKNEKIGTQ